MDAFNLIFIRRTTDLEVKKKKAEQKQKSWWDTLTSWRSGNSNSDSPGRLTLLNVVLFKMVITFIS
jgi:hypothetical protein